MEDNGSDTNLPWEIEGVSEEVQHAAAAAAAEDGVALGAWLSRAVSQGPMVAAGYDDSPRSIEAPSDASLDALRHYIGDRLEQSDARILALAGSLTEIVTQVVETLEPDDTASPPDAQSAL